MFSEKTSLSSSTEPIISTLELKYGTKGEMKRTVTLATSSLGVLAPLTELALELLFRLLNLGPTESTPGP